VNNLKTEMDTNGSKYTIFFFLLKIRNLFTFLIIEYSFDKTNLSIREPDKIGTTYFTCSQSSTLSNYKNSNRKRMVRYECNGRLTIWVNLKTEYAHVRLQHDHLHERPSFQPLVSDEVKEEIERNKHLDPLQLRNHLSIQFDMSNITGKQIYY
jgi:hypothetical protein